MGKTEKDVFTYIRKSLDKGYSFKKIEEGLIKAGYRKKVSEGIILKYKHKRNFFQWFAVSCLAVLFIGSMFITGSGIVGMATVEYARGFSDSLNLLVKEDSKYSWVPDFKGEIKSVGLTGNYINGRRAKVYLENNDEKILIFDSIADNYKVSSVKTNLIEGQLIHFDKVCEDSCFVFLNDSDYDLIFDIDEGELEIESISYDITTMEKDVPKWTEIPQINIDVGKEIEINLSTFFDYDKQRDYGYLSASQGLNVYMIGDKAFISPSEQGDFFLYFIAKMGQVEIASNLVKVTTKEGMGPLVVKGGVRGYTEERTENYWMILVLLVAVLLSIFAIVIMLRKSRTDIAVKIDSMSKKRLSKEVKEYEEKKFKNKKDISEMEKDIEKISKRLRSPLMKKYEKLEDGFLNSKSKKKKREFYKDMRKVYSKLMKEKMPAKQKIELYKNMKKYFKKIS